MAGYGVQWLTPVTAFPKSITSASLTNSFGCRAHPEVGLVWGARLLRRLCGATAASLASKARRDTAVFFDSPYPLRRPYLQRRRPHHDVAADPRWYFMGRPRFTPPAAAGPTLPAAVSSPRRSAGLGASAGAPAGGMPAPAPARRK